MTDDAILTTARAGACLGILATLLGGAAARGQPPAWVVVDPARLESVEQWREVTGELRAVRRSLLAAQEEGLVVDLLRQEVIARLHDVRAVLDVERAAADAEARKALVVQREADAEKMGRDLSRIEEMVSRGAGNERERDNARTDQKTAAARLDQARAELAAAEAQLGLARQRLADLTIEAPFGGVVVSRRTDVGQWLQRGDAVVEIVALDLVAGTRVAVRSARRADGTPVVVEGNERLQPGQPLMVRPAGAPGAGGS
jgi:multidrug efflux pump subunit AcrA (membrane-fusion protein)